MKKKIEVKVGKKRGNEKMERKGGKEVMSVEEFKNMKRVYEGNKEKREKILEIMNRIEYVSMKEIKRRSKVKWVYGEVMRLVENGKIKREKKGKKYWYIRGDK